MKLKKLLSAVMFAAFSQMASAAIVTDLYGDVDGTGTDTGGFGITDKDLAGTQLLPSYSWTQTFAVGGPITSASVSVGHSADGFQGLGGRLKLDGTQVGTLTDLDNCNGSGDPGLGSRVRHKYG